jgi:hypothetical protein
MLAMRGLGYIGWVCGAALWSAAALAQPINGPPIDANQVFQSQPRPTTTLPSPSVTTPGAPSSPTTVPLVPQGRIGQDRVSRCQHQAGVERIPRRKRGAYIHNCVQAD